MSTLRDWWLGMFGLPAGSPSDPVAEFKRQVEAHEVKRKELERKQVAADETMSIDTRKLLHLFAKAEGETNGG